MSISKSTSVGQVLASAANPSSRKERGGGGVVPPPEGVSPTTHDESQDPQVAVGLDGEILLLAKDAGARNLEGYERLTYIRLRGERAEMVRAHLAGAGADVASRILGQFPMK